MISTYNAKIIARRSQQAQDYDQTGHGSGPGRPASASVSRVGGVPGRRIKRGGAMRHQTQSRRRHPILLLLLLPLVAVLVPEIYNRAGPAIGGMPFFYWYQLAWIGGVAVCTGIVYVATRSRR
jgi:hypothetical protein